MRIGVLSVILAKEPLAQALKYLSGLGVAAVELGSGGYAGTAHCNPPELLADSNGQKIKDLKSLVADNGMIISALSVHGNPVHPHKETAEHFNKIFENFNHFFPNLICFFFVIIHIPF